MIAAIVITAVVSVIITAAVVVLVLNLTPGERNFDQAIEVEYGVADEQFERSMSCLLTPVITEGNDVQPLINGDEIFAAMLDAIAAAQRTITFETYIYWEGDIGRRFAEALMQRAADGVKVHVLLDYFGCTLTDGLLCKMQSVGIEVYKYHELSWYHISRMNNRTHRKLLVIDGRVGFTGGVGIADEWQGNARNADEWRDSHYRVEGPVVAQMQSAFMDNWLRVQSNVLHGDDYFPRLEPRGNMRAHMFRSSAREGSESTRLMYLFSIAAARTRITLANSYFVPDSLATKEMLDVRKRGVELEIIVPGVHTDEPAVRAASRSRWGPLLKAGVRIYEYQHTMFHTKVMVIDDQWVSVGSTNFDNRSFRLNDEANLNIFDEGLAKNQNEQFEIDKQSSREITYEEWRHRPISERIKENIAERFRSQL